MIKKLSKFILSWLPPFYREKVIMVFFLQYFPNIRKPNTFNEKIAYRKLLQYDSRFSILSDKYKVREYVKERIGESYLTELYAVYEKAEDVSIADLPVKFVIKPTHDSKSSKIVDDKSKVNLDKLKKDLHKSLTTIPSFQNEYWYQEIEPKIIIEERLVDLKYNVPIDYKFYVFSGKVEYIQVDISRYENHTRNIYDRDWKLLEVRYIYPSGGDIHKPKMLYQMIQIAETLGESIDFVRVDLYCVSETRIVFGEMTFAPEAGRRKFIPGTFDLELGRKWKQSK